MFTLLHRLCCCAGHAPGAVSAYCTSHMCSLLCLYCGPVVHLVQLVLAALVICVRGVALVKSKPFPSPVELRGT